MKGLNQFARFDFTEFCRGKKFTVTGSKEWVDYETKQLLGTMVEVVITEDHTEYKPGKDGRAISNLFEKMKWKIKRDINIPVGVQVEPVDGVATIYGEYRNQLAVQVADIKVIGPSGGKG